MRRHNYLARRARLKSCKSQNPKPPNSWGIHILSRVIQWRPLLFCFFLHQKVEIALLSLSVMPCGRRKHDIIYIRRVWGTYLTKTSLPPYVRNLAGQAFMRLFNLSCTNAKTFFFELQIYSGRSKYILMPPSLYILHAILILRLGICATLLPKVMEDFFGFSNCPDASL